jgi:putative ABC transport system permease protein
MRALWAAGLLLRRLRVERGIVALIFVLVAGTSFVFASAPRLFDRVAVDGLRYAARAAPAEQRNITLSSTAAFTPGAAGGVSAVRSRGDRLEAQFPATVAALISGRQLRVTTVRFYVPKPPIYETHLSLRYQDGLTEATRLVDGRWPVDRGVPLRQPGDPVEPGHQPPGSGSDPRAEPGPVILEAAFSTAEATEIGVKVGDHLAVTLDNSDPLIRQTGAQITATEIEVVGLYEPLEPSSDYWSRLDELLLVSQHGTEDHPIAYATAYVPAEMYPSLGATGLPFHNEWRYLVDPDRVDASRLDQLQLDLRRLGRIDAGDVTLVTALPRIVERFAADRARSESVLSIAAIGPFALAAGAMAMVAILLVGRRRATLALTRGRGASGALVLGTQLWESILLAGTAAIVGLLLAMVLINATSNASSVALSIGVAVAASLILVGASWTIARRSLGQVERDDPPVFRVAPRRLVIELTIVLVAVGATLLLRQRGLGAGATGEVAAVDPLLSSVPVLGGLAAGIVALRLYPVPIRALGWVAARRRDVVPVLGLRTIGRNPAAANLPLLVLLLTAAFGSFSSVVVTSLDRGQVTASYLNTGADLRVEEIGIGVLSPYLKPETVEGVEAAAPGIVDPSARFAMGTYQRSTIFLESVDPVAYQDVVGGTPADPRWPRAFLEQPTKPGAGTDADPIPAIVSRKLPVGSGNLAIGDTFRMTVSGQSMLFQVAEQRATFAGIDERLPFAVVPFNWLFAAFENGPLPPSVVWLRAPAEVKARMIARIAEQRDLARVVSRYDDYAVLHDAPLVAAIPAGYRLALLVAAAYMAMTIIGALVLAGARRTRDLAFLRTLGITGRQSLALTIMEHAPPVLLALIPGVALGIGIAVLCEPGLGLEAFVGSSGVPLSIDWPQLLAIAAGLTAVVVVAVGAGTWLSRRGRMVDALRIGDD